MLKNKYLFIIFLLFLFIFIPVSSAGDNNNDLIEMDNTDIISDNFLLNERVDNYKEIISAYNPNKELTDDDLKNDSVIYLTNGEYDYKQEYEHKNITVIGEDASKTIINGNGRTIHISEFLSINNLTLKNIKVYAPEDLSATNVIFRDYKYNDSEMYYTGMIYNDYGDSSNINIVNCTFYNNTMAEYGLIEVYDSALNIKDSKIIANKNVLWNGYDLYGLIYATYSVFNISNSEFNNNTINSPSGVFYCEYTPITMTNCRFVNNTANSNACIRATNRDVIIDGCEFINNTGKTHFGSITINNGNLYISNSNFVNNSAIKRGGSICHTSYSVYDLSVDNCTFYDSKAQVGGAIYTYSGNININDCKFYNCQATNGGAISFDNAYDYASKLFINITSTEFIDCYSKSKGGAIYCQRSLSFNGFNLSIVNAVSKYGAGIYSEYCDAKFDNLNMINSSSDYAGAFFLETGYLTLTDSLLSGNTGDLGSSLYLSEIYYALIENNTFKNNNASRYGSAIYIVSYSQQDLSKNIYENNSAKDDKIVYSIYISYDIDNLIITNRNYTFIIGNYTDADDIPPYYNLVDLNQTTSVKDQEHEGNCWAFAAIGGLESNALKANGLLVDLSENNMKNIASDTSPVGWDIEPNSGGDSYTPIGYLVSWFGPVLEEDDPYIDISTQSNLLDSVLHVQNILNIKRNNFTDNDEIKKAIMKYGGVQTGIYSTHEVKQYYNKSHRTNHAVVIVGWNDTMEIPGAPGPGAWICKNSWGPEWGENGYFYVSYYDTSCPSDDGFLGACTIIFNSTTRYEKNYQYDQSITGFIDTEFDTIWYKNRFNATNNELLAGASTYFEEDSLWDLSVYVNDALKLTKSGSSKSGYWTIDFEQFIPLVTGDIFEIEFKVNRQNVNVPICEGKEFVYYFYGENISFISVDGETWNDLYYYDWNGEGGTALQVACIKAFTVINNETFTMLSHQIESSENYLELTNDYAYSDIDEEFANGITISKDNFTIDGKGHTINGNGQARIFNITGNNVTLKNLVLIRGNAEKGGAIYATSSFTLNNVTFSDNYATKEGGAVCLYGDVTLNCDNAQFKDNYAEAGSAIYVEKGKLNLYNAELSSEIFNKYSQIAALTNSTIYIENATFANSSSSYSPALYLRNTKTSIINSKFINLKANITAGAIGVRLGGKIYIKNCEFINTTSSKNAGAVYADIDVEDNSGNMTIIDTIFKDTYSDFGGAYLQLGGYLLLNNCEFINGHATFNGGSVYISNANGTINNCTFDSNDVDLIENYPTYGGAILLDLSEFNITDSKFTNNMASAGGAVYAYDSSYDITNSIFENNINPIYSVFDEKINIDESNVFINDNNISTNNTYYATIVGGEGLQLTLLNNTISVDTIPTRFDLRDWRWTSPVRAQGWMGSCWTFGMTGTLESALLKATGIAGDFSENNMQNTMLKYSIYGGAASEGGINLYSASYLLSWLGAFTQDADTYDEMGKISALITTNEDIHVQDVIFIPNNEIPNGTQLKLAIMKYGSLDVSYYGQSKYDEENPYYDPNTYAQYVDKPLNANHEVSVVGWDDNFPKEKFLITPPGDGAWIIKNSWGIDYGDEGYLYVSYYDKTFLRYTPGSIKDYATTIIFGNTEAYNMNYQYDILWTGIFAPGENISYMNVFEAVEDDAIAAVGTYFNQSGVKYTVEIYVNDCLKLTQEGVSPYLGYHTIKLNEYIPIKTGDIFKAKITSNNMPHINQSDTRIHTKENRSFVSADGGQTWIDLNDEGGVACLKVYTVADSNRTNTTNTFTELERLITASGNHLNLDDDYAFDNETDNNFGINITKDNFVLNGNGHIIDGKNLSRIFATSGNNITLSNLVLINANADKCGAVYSEGTVTLNNITFIDNYASTRGGAIGFYANAVLNINNSKFIDNNATYGPSIYVQNGNLNIYNTEFTSNVHTKDGQITLNNATGYIDNATFANIVSDYATAIHLEKSKALTVINSKFINLTANITSGAITVKNGGVIYIRNCEFTNTTSSKNAGAILADIAGNTNLLPGNVTILDTVFRDTSSGFGGAYIQFGGQLIINNTEFINNHATYNSGSVYISYVDYAEVNDCNFTSNGVDIIEGYPTYGGAMVIDMSTITINNSRFINNTASAGNAIYAYDASYAIKNSLFENNANAIYTFFDKECSLENNTFINDNISTNNTFYATIQVGEGLQLTLLNNTISVDSIPKKFDLRDWEWVSPVQNQGWMGACWTFGMTGTLESALLKATGIATDLSENNMQDTMLRYSNYGITSLLEGGGNIASVGYLLSWLGAFIQDADTYDEMGKLSPLITTNKDIHVQDVMFTPNNEIPYGTQLKLAIMKYGSIDVSYNGQSTYNEVTPYYNPNTYAQYVNDSSVQPNHAVSIVGWDDNFPKEKFGITPPGDGAWIVKNSWGTEWGENGYLYVSYYDKTLLKSDNILTYATSIIIENTVPYNKNYQYDMFWGGDFVGNGTVRYMNVFEALENDAIAAVGTYFNQSGINYTVEIYVNDMLKLTQEGVSPYYGYHTIKLNNYIPIKEGDIFKAVITSNGMPRVELKDSRVHYTNNISFISFDGKTWDDAYELDYIACLKVYTVALPFYTEDLVKIYKNDSKFEANIGVANETVTFEVNGVSYNRTSDENGTARIAINLNPGDYTIKTTFNGTTVENTITVLPTLIADNLVKYFRNASQFYIGLIDGEGNPVAGKNITMNINGVLYNRVTNENGTAKLNINLNPGDYILTATDPLTGLMMSYNITVLPTLNATDLEMKYRDGSKFMVSVLDGQGKPLANAKVTFNINGVFYTRTSDSEGIAKLNINLMAGKYIITSEYDRLRISNTITIKD